MEFSQLEFLKNYLIQTFGLEYTSEEQEGQVCYLHAHDEMRPEFRLVFTLEDLKKYFSHLEKFKDQSDYFTKHPEGFLPKSESIFWEIVEQKLP
ncbi:hypothetical protein [Elizabethkingia sp. JS20170427COW]|uniref:hypothetical protein n=1 Tax=Elizabethkingia sp. JS20170427COW TaxID=2583851 RepID=UPI001110CB0E|nr:hypothetical protein [Elizabethkingia sp. JS20170427COW]QCX53268.1 hypothetical protein FGE20_05745 [Elizabethkingia sp. JS20170427COW]